MSYTILDCIQAPHLQDGIASLASKSEQHNDGCGLQSGDLTRYLRVVPIQMADVYRDRDLLQLRVGDCEEVAH